MLKPKTPVNEKERLAVLDSYNILDSSPEQEFDDLTLIASQICDAPIALISLIDKDRQWFKSKFGLEAKETPSTISFCRYVIDKPSEAFEVKDAKNDPRFADNPLVEGDLNIGFYLGIPLVDSTNLALGTLCVIDHKSRELSEGQIQGLQALARQVMRKIEQRKKDLEIDAKLDQGKVALTDSESKYSVLYNEAPDIMISVDPETKKIIDCNNTTCIRLNYSRSEMIGQNLFNFFHKDSHSSAKLILKNFIKTGKIENERLILNTKTGQKIHVSINAKAIRNSNGAILRSISVLRDINDLVNAENKLKALNKNLEEEVNRRSSALILNQEKLALALESTTDILLDWPNIKEDHIWWSDILPKALGFADSELEKSMAIFTGLAHANDLENIMESINNCLKHDIPFDLEFRLKTKEGDYLWVRGRGNAVKNEEGVIYRMTGLLTDINEKKALELELDKTKNFLEKVTSIAPSVIYVFDQETMSNEYANREIGKVLGYTTAEIQSLGDQMLPTLCHPEDLNSVFSHFADIKGLENNSNISVEYRMQHKNGKYVHMLSEDTVFERNNKGEVTKHLGVATDITTVKEGHIKLAEQARMLQKQNDDLKQFAYVAMHDLKSPMGTLEGHFNFLKKQFTEPEAEIAESISFIEEEIENFTKTVNELNAAIQVRDQDIETEIIALNPEIEKVLTVFGNQMNNLKGAVTVSLADEDSIIGSKVYIKSVLTNLISNAIKYRNPEIAPVIGVRTYLESKFLVIEIEDNGIGIDTELHKDRLFKMFNRFHHHSEGTGMGLYMVKSMVEKMGGFVKIESKVDKGTKISVSLKAGYGKVE